MLSRFLHYRFIAIVFVAYFLLSGIFRAVLALQYDSISIWTYLYGLRMDMIIISLFLFIALFLFTLKLEKAARLYLAILFPLLLLLELINLNFFEEFNLRLNYLFIENLPFLLQLAPMLIKDYGFAMLLALIGLPALGYFIYKKSGPVFNSQLPLSTRLLVLPVVMLLLIVTGRGSFDRSPPNPSYYSWSSNNTTNEISNNTLFSLLSSSFFHSGTTIANYGKRPDLPRMDFMQTIKSQYKRKKHIALILMESFGYQYVGSLGGTPTSPEFDAMSKQGLFFSNMHSASNRTNRGMESVISSVYPYAGSSYMKLPSTQSHFWTLAQTLKSEGYKTIFLYGGDANFDNMRAFLLSNGFDEVIDASNIAIDKAQFAWGYADEDTYDKAAALLNSEQPVFLFMLTLSNHKPFDFPGGRIEPYQKAPLKSFENANKYADWALGRFVHTLNEQGFFRDSLLAMVADHSAHVRSPLTVPVEQYRVPALFLANDLPRREIKTMTHQADIAPTLLDAAGFDVTVPAQGNNMLEKERSRALIVRRGSYAYVTDKGQVIYRKEKAPEGEPSLVDEGLRLIYDSFDAFKTGKHQLVETATKESPRTNGTE